MSNKEPCKTPGCEGDQKSLGLCSACYSYLYYWHKKTPKALIHRQHQIQMYTTRMDMLGAPVSITHTKISAKNRLTVLPGDTSRYKNKKRKVG